MKRCRKDAAGPDCLSALCARDANATWEDLRNQSRDCYQQIRTALRVQQGCLCAYCELRLHPDNEQVAHFHPKSDTSGAHNWALDWGNLWLACKGGTRWSDQRDAAGQTAYPLPANRSCDEATENRVLDGIVLRPDEIPRFPPLFRFRPYPNALLIEPDPQACEAAGIAPERVRDTIDQLNLNCRRLAELRSALHRDLEQIKARLRESHNPDVSGALRRLAAFRLEPDEQGYLKAFFSVSRWSLGQAAEDFLRASGFGDRVDGDTPGLA